MKPASGHPAPDEVDEEILADPASGHTGFDCLAEPPLCGIRRTQAYLVDHIKRAALRQLHRSPRGERLLLRMYLMGEAQAVKLHGAWAGEPPAWAAPHIGQHVADERHHVAAFTRALKAHGEPAPAACEPDAISRRKIARWQQLARQYAPRFAQGAFVPIYATCLCEEQMAVRVLTRHDAVIGVNHPLSPLISRVLADETRHVQFCMMMLQRLVVPPETPTLTALLAKVRAIDAGFGITGALAMYAAGLCYRLCPGKRMPAAVG